MFDSAIGNENKKVTMVAIVIVTLLIGCFQAYATDELWIIDRWAHMPYDLGLATDSENDVILTYRLRDAITLDSKIRTEKVSSESGKSLWWSNCEFDGVGYARDVTVDSQDNVIVVGDSDVVGDSGLDWVIVKYYPDGTEDWRTEYDSGGYDINFGVAVDLNDEIIVTGKSDGSCITLRFDADGVLLDEMTYVGDDATPYDVTTDAEGNVIVVGHEGLSEPDYFVVKYDLDGDEMWSHTYHRYGTDIAYGVVADMDGNVYVTGYSQFEHETGLPFYGYLTLKYDSSGILVWAEAYDNEAWSSYAHGIAIDQCGCIYVTGISNEEILTIRYNQDGQANLVKRYSFDADEGVGMRVAVDSSGNLIVLGYEGSDPYRKIYAMKYLISTVAEDASIETRVEAVEEELGLLRALLETIQEIIENILNWIDSLPPGLSGDTGKPGS